MTGPAVTFWGRCVGGQCEGTEIGSFQARDIYPLVFKEVLLAEEMCIEHREHYTWDTDHWRFVESVRWRLPL